MAEAEKRYIFTKFLLPIAKYSQQRAESRVDFEVNSKAPGQVFEGQDIRIRCTSSVRGASFE